MKTKIFAIILTSTLTVPAIGQVLVQTPVAGATPVLVQGIVQNATVPYVVATAPANGDTRVNPSLRAIRITFSEPMDVATFYWPLPAGGQQGMPVITGDPYWENANRTVVLPVRLNVNSTYRVPINQGNQAIFRSAKGLAVYPGYLSFRTLEGVVGGVPNGMINTSVNVPRGFNANDVTNSRTPRAGDEPGLVGSNRNVNRTPIPSTGIPQTMQQSTTNQAPNIPTGGISAGAKTRVKTPRPTLAPR